MKQPNTIDVDYVNANHNIENERQIIKAGVSVGKISNPLHFSFATTLGGEVPLNTITQEASVLASNIRQLIHSLVETSLDRQVSVNELKRSVVVSVAGNGDLYVSFKVSRKESREECANRLTNQARLRRLKNEKYAKADKTRLDEQKEYATYRRLKRKFEYNVDAILAINENNK